MYTPTPAPVYGRPAYGQPAYGQPAYGQPQYGQPQYGQPQYGQPQYGLYGDGNPYAHWGLRVAARLLDTVLLIPFYIVFFVGFGTVASSLHTDPVTGQVTHGAGLAVGLVVLAAGVLVALGFGIWNQIVRQGRTGQSLGKQWMSIKVIDERTGQPLGVGMNFVRELAHVIDGIACDIGYLWPLWDPKRQTFADKIMTSVVVPAPKVPDAAYAPPQYPTA